MEEVALGDQDETAALFQLQQRVFDAGQGLDRVGHHLATGVEQFADNVRRDLAVADLERGLEHREREALRAIAVGLHVLAFDGGKLRLKRVFVGKIAQQFVESLVGQAEHGFRVPERVVCIDADDLKRHAGS